MALNVRASSKTIESTGIVDWNVSSPAAKGDPFLAIGLDSSSNVKIQLAVTTDAAAEKQPSDVTIDIQSTQGQWKIVNGHIQGTTPDLDGWTKGALAFAANDLKEYQDSMQGTAPANACYWCTFSGLGASEAPAVVAAASWEESRV